MFWFIYVLVQVFSILICWDCIFNLPFPIVFHLIFYVFFRCLSTGLNCLNFSLFGKGMCNFWLDSIYMFMKDIFFSFFFFFFFFSSSSSLYTEFYMSVFLYCLYLIFMIEIVRWMVTCCLCQIFIFYKTDFIF